MGQVGDMLAAKARRERVAPALASLGRLESARVPTRKARRTRLLKSWSREPFIRKRELPLTGCVNLSLSLSLSLSMYIYIYPESRRHTRHGLAVECAVEKEDPAATPRDFVPQRHAFESPVRRGVASSPLASLGEPEQRREGASQRQPERRGSSFENSKPWSS